MGRKYKIIEQPPIPDPSVVESHKDFTKLLYSYDRAVAYNNLFITSLNTIAIVLATVAICYTIFFSFPSKAVPVDFVNHNNKIETEEFIPHRPSPTVLPTQAATKKFDENQDSPLNVEAKRDEPRIEEYVSSSGNKPARSPSSVIINAKPITGIDSLYQYFRDSLKYPAEKIGTGISGEVTVAFSISKEGDIQDINIINSLSPSFDNEAIRLIRNMPPWKPAMINGTPISSKVSIPIIFNNDSLYQGTSEKTFKE